VVADSATKPPKETLNPKVQELLTLINKAGVSQVEVISILFQYDIPTEEAAESGIVDDLPDESVEIAIKQWGSVVWNI
jgi:hypothetical protein